MFQIWIFQRLAEMNWVGLTSSAHEFVDVFVNNSVHEDEQMRTSQSTLAIDDLVRRCLEMAAEHGISKADIDAEFPNLAEHFRFMIVINNAGTRG